MRKQLSFLILFTLISCNKVNSPKSAIVPDAPVAQVEQKVTVNKEEKGISFENKSVSKNIHLNEGEYLKVILSGSVKAQKIMSRDRWQEKNKRVQVMGPLPDAPWPTTCLFARENYVVTEEKKVDLKELNAFIFFEKDGERHSLNDLVEFGGVEIENEEGEFAIVIKEEGFLAEDFTINIQKLVINEGEIGFYDARECSRYMSAINFTSDLKPVNLESAYSISGKMSIHKKGR